MEAKGGRFNQPRFRLTMHAAERLAERGIERAWVELALDDPGERVPDPRDPQLRHALRSIPERDGRVLRVVYNPHVRPVLVISAFFDRRLRA